MFLNSSSSVFAVPVIPDNFLYIRNKFWKVIVAAFVLGVLNNGMQLINLGTYPQYIAKGVIMLLSLYLTNRNAQGM